jgi:phosphoenolpyruvate phosphomutase
MLRISGEGRDHVLAAMEVLRARPDFNDLGLTDLVNQLIEQGHAPQVQYVSGHWMDINDLQDLQRAGDFAQGHSS